MKREYLSREEKKRKILLEIKKGKLKTKKLLKITKLGKQENSVQPADRTKAVQVWCLGYIYIYIFTKTWKVAAITASIQYLKINSGFHARTNPKQQYLKVVASRSVMLHSAKSALMFTTMQPSF